MANTIDNMNNYGTGWFKFDEASGNAIDSKGTAIGTVTGATRVTGWNGQGSALSFNGTSSYVLFNQKIIPIGKKSIRFKIKSSSSVAFQTVFTTTYGGGDTGVTISLRSGGIRFEVRESATINVVTSSYFISDGLWHDVLIVDKGLNNIEIYVDDFTTPKVTHNFNVSVNMAMNFRIGSTDGNNFFNGQIDELEIYNEAISPIPDKTLILHNGQYKHYTTSWQTIGATVTDLSYKTNGMEDISSISESAWSQLTGNVELTLWSDYQPKTEAQFNIETNPFTLADEFKGKEIKVLEYTDSPSQAESKVETEVEPYSIYDEFGDTMEVLYYTDNTTRTKADLEITANYSPLDELEGDFEVVTWSDTIDETVQISIPQLTPDAITEGTIYETPLNLENVVKVK